VINRWKPNSLMFRYVPPYMPDSNINTRKHSSAEIYAAHTRTRRRISAQQLLLPASHSLSKRYVCGQRIHRPTDYGLPTAAVLQSPLRDPWPLNGTDLLSQTPAYTARPQIPLTKIVTQRTTHKVIGLLAYSSTACGVRVCSHTNHCSRPIYYLDQ